MNAINVLTRILLSMTRGKKSPEVLFVGPRLFGKVLKYLIENKYEIYTQESSLRNYLFLGTWIFLRIKQGNQRNLQLELGDKYCPDCQVSYYWTSYNPELAPGQKDHYTCMQCGKIEFKEGENESRENSN